MYVDFLVPEVARFSWRPLQAPTSAAGIPEPQIAKGPPPQNVLTYVRFPMLLVMTYSAGGGDVGKEIQKKGTA
jgi:hypothetical protein